MDKEQINELKPGDEILIRGRFEKIKENGDYSISYLLTTVHGKLYMYKAAVHPSAVIIKSPPKHDPTRPFEEGDIVKPRFVDGRTDIDLSSLHPYTVTKREDSWGNVRVMNNNHSLTTKAVFLELITPVEEQEPFYIETEAFDYEIRNANDDPDIGTSLAFHVKFQDPDEGQILRVKSYYESYVYSREHAKAAAEAERDRLNAEYRKERNNG